MKILFVTQANPNATGAGWERRAAQHIRSLTRIGEVTVLLPWQEAAFLDAAAEGRCRALGATHVIRRAQMPANEVSKRAHAAAKGRLARAWHAIGRASWLDTRVHPRDVAASRAQLGQRFDIVFAFKVQSAIWTESVLGGALRPPIAIVDLDDVESRMFERLVVAAPGHSRFWAWKLKRQLGWLQATERKLVAEWSAVCLCSELDAGRWLDMHGKRPWIVPNGYDFGRIVPLEPDGHVDLLFVGTFGYAPNVEGVLWFVENIWPLVRTALGDTVTLTLVGFTPPASLLALDGRDGIRVIGNAPDVAPFYASTSIVIAPLLAGSGTRIKLIEAAAFGRASVTTTLGCEGLDLVDGEHAEIADDPSAFAHRVIALARNPARRAKLADAAYEHARARFESENVEQTMVKSTRLLIKSVGAPKVSL